MGKTMLADPTWGECAEETGRGFVMGIAGEGRNRKVQIRAHHLNEPLHGWLDTESAAGDVFPRLREGTPVRYRILVHRKAGVPLETPFGDLQGRQKVRDLVELVITDGDVAVDEADQAQRRLEENLQRPTEVEGGALQHAPGGGMAGPEEWPEPDVDDEAAGVSIDDVAGDEPHGSILDAGREATEQRQADRARADERADTPGIRRCQKCRLPLSGPVRSLGGGRYEHRDGCPDAGTPSESPDPGPVSPQPGPIAREARQEPPARHEPQEAPPAGERRRGPKVKEDKPWEETNSDGSPNRGSYSHGAALWAAREAWYLARNPDPFDADADPQEPVRPDRRVVRMLAGWLLEAADEVQARIRRDGRSDRMAQSHRHARDAVRTVLKVHPVPFGADEETREAWWHDVVDDGAMIAGVACELVDEEGS